LRLAGVENRLTGGEQGGMKAIFRMLYMRQNACVDKGTTSLNIKSEEAHRLARELAWRVT
jgi:hypothetical protein